MTTLCTGWTGSAYDTLGNRFISSFIKHWPTTTKLHLVTDAKIDLSDCNKTHSVISHTVDALDGYAGFMMRYKNDPAANGRQPTDKWKESERQAGYSYRWDARKFALQMFIPEMVAGQLPDGEILTWFDADVVTTADVPEGFIEGLLGDADLAYLGRDDKHSEIGFWAVRLNWETREFLRCLAEIYQEGSVFLLNETHSAFVFDDVRIARSYWGLHVKSLTPGLRGHVWPASPLGRYTRHDKGKRKWRA